MRDRQEAVKLDEIIKSLFAVSNEVLIQLLNSLFEENYDFNLTEVSIGNNEFINNDFDTIVGDLFIKMTEENKKPYHYHLEFQTKNDQTMVIRAFEYAFQKGKELSKYENKSEDETIIVIPKQLIIFVEQNSRIKDELKMRIVFPDGQEVKYKVPVMKYWQYTDQDLIQNKMYPLLPLQIFKLRYELNQIARNKGENKEERLQEVILKAKDTVWRIGIEAEELYNKQEIKGDDFHKILLAIENLFEYLNKKYGNDEKLEEEVHAMTKTLYDPAVEKRARRERNIEIAKKFIDMGIDVKKIAEGTGLTVEEVEKLKKDID